MQSLVVTLETAKKLKVAGYKAEWVNFYYVDDGFLVFNHNAYAMKRFTKNIILAPTAQEIADQLPKEAETNEGFKYLDMHRDRGKYWYAYYGTIEVTNLMTGGPTMAEALALLWLKLQEAK